MFQKLNSSSFSREQKSTAGSRICRQYRSTVDKRPQYTDQARARIGHPQELLLYLNYFNKN